MQMRAVVGGQGNFVFFGKNFGGYPLEVETCGQFFARLINRIVELLLVNF